MKVGQSQRFLGLHSGLCRREKRRVGGQGRGVLSRMKPMAALLRSELHFGLTGWPCYVWLV